MLKPGIHLNLLLVALLGGFGGAATAGDALDAALASQPGAAQARYNERHPRATLSFFGIKPGMTVIEALPGGGWYSKILIPTLGPEGRLIGADYAFAMYPKFNFYSAEYIEAKKTWTDTWTADAKAWHGDKGAGVDAFVLGSMPTRFDGQVDAILFVRALHNLARFENDGGYLSSALAEAHRALKSGGIIGVVQHAAPEDAAASWADGSNGYLKKSFVIEKLTAAGFEYVGDNDVNLNPLDKPTESDFVWRLPPSLATSKSDPELAARYREIGESSRMTLLFKKP